MVNVECLLPPREESIKDSDPQDDQEYLAGEPVNQAKNGINPCGNEHWDPKWDEDPFALQ